MRTYRGITDENVNTAIDRLLRDGYSSRNKSTRWDVITTCGNSLPPKLVLKGAAAIAGVKDSTANKGGGWPTNDILEVLGCTIAAKGNSEDLPRPPSELSDSELRKLAVEKGQKEPKTSTVERIIRNRHWAISEYAKRMAKGLCDLCRSAAPFSVDGSPFLECHHVVPLAQNGPDTIENVVALCPNCHRKMHSICADEDRAILRKRIVIRG